ncbi:hypothetical protein AWZ03_013161 [Drosophila navojoa]|uniref:Uncharacterized protein n=1 Tax=Drosophila navojoa TaxID=7232 RepID=A0A484AVI7_DRONA|nr:hypothetical protein AWZ03_013161 [Drosophila navojoa]
MTELQPTIAAKSTQRHPLVVATVAAVAQARTYTLAPNATWLPPTDSNSNSNSDSDSDSSYASNSDRAEINITMS